MFGALLQVFMDMHRPRAGKNLSHQRARSQLRSNKATLPSHFSSYTVKNCPFGSLFSAMVFAVLYLLLVVLLFEMTPKYSGEVPSRGPKCGKAVVCLVEEICVR